MKILIIVFFKLNLLCFSNRIDHDLPTNTLPAILSVSVFPPGGYKNDAGFTTCPALDPRYTSEPNTRVTMPTRAPVDIVRTRIPPTKCKYLIINTAVCPLLNEGPYSFSM